MFQIVYDFIKAQCFTGLLYHFPGNGCIAQCNIFIYRAGEHINLLPDKPYLAADAIQR